MKSKTKLLSILTAVIMISVIFAQEMPLVYDVENTGADFPVPYMPSFAELKTISSLPDPFEWSDARDRITNLSDWQFRRAEIVNEVQYYELGEKPLPPDSVSTSFANDVLTIVVYDEGKTLTLTAQIQYPSTGSAPYPAVIGVGSGSGSLSSDLFLDNGVATIQYNYSEVAPWTQSSRGLGEYYNLYPDKKVGYLTAWSWGVSRIIDGLEKASATDIDTKHLAVTGCSFAGKIALFSGAFDERIALTISQEPGGGGDASWRVSETLDGSRETLSKAQGGFWYHQDVSQFNNAVTKLPFDHHEVMALIAPRALLVLGNPDYEWLADESGYVSCMAAQEVWTALGVPDRFGFSKVGDHSHCQLPDAQKPEVNAFIDKFLLGKDNTNTNIAIHPGYTTNLNKWIKWTTPELSNDTSFFEYSTLIYPPNNETGLDTTVTLKWSSTENSSTYLLQLSSDPAFTTINDSINTSDTSYTITNLLKGEKYYWRVQVKNSIGQAGLFSDIWNFTPIVPLPEKTYLVSARIKSYSTDNVKLCWRKVKYTDNYSIQISEDDDFSTITISGSSTDTTESLQGTEEGVIYYWQVQASNIIGAGPWSDASDFMLIAPPTNLYASEKTFQHILLSWKERSGVEEGYIIERKAEDQDSFTVIDSLNENISEYADKQIEPNSTYTYRVKAYKNSYVSIYSNETSTKSTGIDDDDDMPTEFSISQNYPNPFNPTTRIKFSLPKTGLTTIALFDLQGNKVKTLLNKKTDAGYHELNVNASSLPSGIYIYRIQSGNFNASRKMILMK